MRLFRIANKHSSVSALSISGTARDLDDFLRSIYAMRFCAEKNDTLSNFIDILSKEGNIEEYLIDSLPIDSNSIFVSDSSADWSSQNYVHYRSEATIAAVENLRREIKRERDLIEGREKPRISREEIRDAFLKRVFLREYHAEADMRAFSYDKGRRRAIDLELSAIIIYNVMLDLLDLFD